LGVPCYGPVVPDVLPGLLRPSPRTNVHLTVLSASLLANNFNQLWCDALNRRQQLGLTHFAMLHADIAVPTGWLDALVAEQQRVGADLLSAVVPIKSEAGLTSTGLRAPDAAVGRRLTMREVMRLPVTFCAADTDSPTHWLLVNSGLWVCDFTRPWVEEAHFWIGDRIVRDPSGRFRAEVLAEDWNFSDWCARRGLKVFATRVVPVKHFGTFGYPNDRAWGEWETDRDFAR
jgi:hypothetical protein